MKKNKTREERAPSLANRNSIDPRILKELAKKAASGGYDAISQQVEHLWEGETMIGLDVKNTEKELRSRRISNGPPVVENTEPKPAKKEKEKPAEKKIVEIHAKNSAQRFRPPKQNAAKAERWKELRKYDSVSLNGTPQLSQIQVDSSEVQKNWLLPKVRFSTEDFRFVYSLSSK